MLVVEKKQMKKINKLALITQQGFVSSRKETDEKINKLALITQQGFVSSRKETDEKIDKLAQNNSAWIFRD